MARLPNMGGAKFLADGKPRRERRGLGPNVDSGPARSILAQGDILPFEAMPNHTRLRIAIVGAGVGGLTLALALRQRGIAFEIFEQAHELAEIGAAVALSANGTRELKRLGVLDSIVSSSTEPTELIYRDGRTGARIAAHPVRLGQAYRLRFGAPYCGLHRADLQRVLSAALGGDGLHLGRRLVELEDRGEAVALTFANGAKAEAEIVVAADGVRSVARRHVVNGDALHYSQTTGFRGIVPTSRLPRLPDAEAIQFWMGPRAHLPHYAIGPKGDHVNFLAVVDAPDVWPHPEKGLVETTSQDALAFFEGWHPAVVEMIDAVRHDLRWGLFVARPLPRWRRGRVVLLGDAAHAMLPHHGQGANVTIEDAIALAERLAAGGDPLMALDAYEASRRPRTRRIQRASWAASKALHLDEGPERDRRNSRLKSFPDWFGWIHAFDARGHSGGQSSEGAQA